MEKFELVEEKDQIHLLGLNNFNPKHIFECGQAFRWKREEDQSYTAIAYDRVINVKEEEDRIILSKTNRKDFENIWFDYFDLGRDYGPVKKQLSQDPILEEAIEHGWGIRILNQEPFETIISFIISANNQIPRIKKSIEIIADNYGNPIDNQLAFGDFYYSFPHQEILANLDPGLFQEVSRTGFRAKRIIESSKMIRDGHLILDQLYHMDKEDGKKLLMTLPGVGPKVSECILLFAFKKSQAFPVDVWVKRVMEHFYFKEERNIKDIGQEGSRLFGNLAGFAQQYLFYYAREEAIGK